jgi:AMMECR1 domain-containing protein
MRFLTGNTRLKNNKNNVLVGIYHSNSQLTETDDLISLDDYLRNKIGALPITQLRERLKKYSFESGFEERRFSPFKTYELQKIMKAWK